MEGVFDKKETEGQDLFQENEYFISSFDSKSHNINHYHLELIQSIFLY